MYIKWYIEFPQNNNQVYKIVIKMHIIQLLNDFKVYIQNYSVRICNINRAAVGREVQIANLSKEFFNVYRGSIQ